MSMVDGYAASGDMFKMGADNFQNGNVLGGIYNWLMGGLNIVGNTLTFGLANEIGKNVRDDIQAKTTVEVDENTHFVEAKQAAGKDKLNFAEKIVLGFSNSNASAYNLAAHGEAGAANLLSGIDLANLVIECTPIGLAGGAAKGLTTAAGKIGAKIAAKQAGTVVAKNGASIVVREATEQGTKICLKETTKNALKVGATKGVDIAKTKVVKSGTKKVANQLIDDVELITTGLVKDCVESSLTKKSVQAGVTKALSRTALGAIFTQVNGQALYNLVSNDNQDLVQNTSDQSLDSVNFVKEPTESAAECPSY